MTSTDTDPNSTDRNSNNESVQVIVRCRPLSLKEQEQECSNIVKVYSNRGVIEVENLKAKTENERNKIFTYDAVYDEISTQQSIYDETIRPLVVSVLDGYNGCVFAYGQTGTGKTYTMEGDDDEEGENMGIIPRTFNQIWSHISRKTGVEFLVSVRYIEIYMEEIRDLLRIKSTKSHELRELPDSGVVVTNLHSQTCQSAKDMLKAMRNGNFNRTTGATNMNEHSSRSHAIFQIIIEMAEVDSKTMKVGKLNLVDLAGSERQSKTGATGDRLKEATKINKALSSLGNVIYALAENSSHIPYRDSKLTRLLQDSLGGNSKTIMIANVGPANINYEETITTLRYAYRAKSIKNKPIKNEDIKNGKLLLLQEEIERLKALISEKSNGIEINGLDSEGEDENSESEINEGEKEKQLEVGKLEVDELAKKLRALEKQMVHGGKNILDSVNENELKLEQQRLEIADRKKREREIQQRLELEEETCTELKQVFASLQQQVDYKRDKMKRLNSKLQQIRQEMKDNHEVYLKDRQELEEANNEAAMQLRKLFLIIDNFIPSEERSRILSLAYFDENVDNWMLRKEMSHIEPTERPIAHNYRRPISDYALQMGRTSPNYRGENVLDLKLDMPLRITQDYTPPAICPQVKAIVTDLIQNEIDNSHLTIKMAPHSSARGTSKLEQENKYKMATKIFTDVHNLKNNRTVQSKSAKAHH
ncbi:kinesin-like protein Klp68D [Cylas formicarius]|uniref:kinesin-like protein Klp68D n=1 Tax=Cylas formicarius TaxID=197179 RepID=UPI0029586683|nr:kinesin-like protein Klp68D [Cylas formicarius]